MKRIAVLGSGEGTNLQALIDARDLGGRIALVISDMADSGVLKKAEAAGIETLHVKPGKDLCSRLLDSLTDIDLVCLAGFMRIVKEPLLTAFEDRIINIHPSLLPAYPGKEAWRQALDDGASETGCTVHFVDAGVDTGEIILQEKVSILAGDTPEVLHRRIQEAEHRLYPAAVQTILQ